MGWKQGWWSLFVLAAGCTAETAAVPSEAIVAAALSDTSVCIARADGFTLCEGVDLSLEGPVLEGMPLQQLVVEVEDFSSYRLYVVRGLDHDGRIVAVAVSPGAGPTTGAPTSAGAVAIAPGGDVLFSSSGKPDALTTDVVESLGGHGCGILAEGGRAECWEQDGLSFSEILRDRAVREVDGPCVLYADGMLDCPFRSSLRTQAPREALIDLDVDGSGGSASEYACGVIEKDGSLACWGSGRPAVEPPSGAFRAVRTASRFACAIPVAAEPPICWSRFGRRTPIAAPVSDIQLTGSEGCAILSEGGAVQCWDSTTTLPPFSSAMVSLDRDCGLAADGGIYCWDTNVGGGFRGPLNEVPMMALERDTALSTDGRLYQLSSGQVTPFAPADGRRFVAIEQLGSWRCGLNDDRRLQCWRYDDESTEPFRGALDGGYRFIRTGPVMCGATREQGALDCWGQRGSEPLLAGAPMVQNVDSILLADVACVTASSRTHCWGDDSRGLVSGAPDGITFSGVWSEARDYMCGVNPEGSLSCWGEVPAWLSFHRRDR